MKTKAEPRNFWGGEMPCWRSWRILLDYATKHAADAKAGKLDRVLNALETPNIGNFGELKAFYEAQGMNDRAARFQKQ